MSWYRDPQLFIICGANSHFYVYRITKQFGTPVVEDDRTEREKLSFSKHLSLDSNRESDSVAFKATFPTSGIRKHRNSQGLVINWDGGNKTGTWSREDLNTAFWKLPGIKTPEMLQTENRAL
ncbi:hypothetical protein MKX03_015699, partial [Papaver bracteatum]